MLKKPAQVAPTMSTLHEDANVEEAEEEEIDVLEASKVPEDKCQLLPSSTRPSATLLDRGHVKDHHQLHPSQTTTTAMTAATEAMVCIISCSFFPTGCICILSKELRPHTTYICDTNNVKMIITYVWAHYLGWFTQITAHASNNTSARLLRCWVFKAKLSLFPKNTSESTKN